MNEMMEERKKKYEKNRKQKRNEQMKRENKRGMNKVMLIGIMAFALLFGIILISALTTEEQNALVNELNIFKYVNNYTIE